MVCPKCGSDKVYPSRLRNDNEFFIAMVSSFSPYRCMGCQHRWWRFRFRGKQKGERASLVPDFKGGYHRLRRDLKMWWPQNRGRIIPLTFKVLVLAGIAVAIAMLISYSTEKMKDTSDLSKPTKAIKR